jgi:hypothetical protein
MLNRAAHPRGGRGKHEGTVAPPLPRPTLQFRLRAWRQFQRALDPLAPPKPLRQPRIPTPLR